MYISSIPKKESKKESKKERKKASVVAVKDIDINIPNFAEEKESEGK